LICFLKTTTDKEANPLHSMKKIVLKSPGAKAKHNMKFIQCLLPVFLLASCASKHIKFTAPPEEMITTRLLSDFLKENKYPKIVLRTHKATKKTTESEDVIGDYNDLYNAIEKEFLNSGYIVRDRALFEQVVSNSANTINYEELGAKSDTELIIELSKLDMEVLYQTNKYYSGRYAEKERLLNYMYSRYGVSVEFKIVLIRNNELAGSYQFNYAPCSERPCEINAAFIREWKAVKRGKREITRVEKNVLESFLRDATRQLVYSMRGI